MTLQTKHTPIPQLRLLAQKALLEKADQDRAFADLLKTNPHSAIKALFGADPIPDHRIQVIEEQPGEIVLVLPHAIDESELPDALLDLASGGVSYDDYVWWKKACPASGSNVPAPLDWG